MHSGVRIPPPQPAYAKASAGLRPESSLFKRLPISLRTAVLFPDRLSARRFEAYLKSGSGRAFSKRHFRI